jgi:hypothetical protein
VPNIATDAAPFIAAWTVAVVTLLMVWRLRRKDRWPRRRMGRFRPFLRKSAEDQRSELLDRQLEAVMREHVTFSKSRVMGGGEYGLFRAVLTVTRQPLPTGSYPFYVFPQVSLGQIIRTQANLDWHADQAHRAINSKRCDFLIADRNGDPIAVLEYQGLGHNIGGTAVRRDEIKRIALERAGVRYVEIKHDATPAEMQQTVRDLLTPNVVTGQPTAAFSRARA